MAGDPIADAAAAAASGPGGWIAGIATGLSLLGIGAYRALRSVRADSAGDRAAADVDARRKELDGLMRDALATMTKERDEQQRRADGFAVERMKLAAEVAGMSARLDAMRAEIDTLKTDKRELQERLKSVEAEMDLLERTFDAVVEEAAITKSVLAAHGVGHLLSEIQTQLDGRLTELGLRRVRGVAQCAPASPPGEEMHDRAVAAKAMRLSGNDAPLQSTPRVDPKDFDF